MFRDSFGEVALVRLQNPLPPGTFASLFASRYASLRRVLSLSFFFLISPFLYFQREATCCAITLLVRTFLNKIVVFVV